MASRSRIGLVLVALALGLMEQVGTGQQRRENGSAPKPDFDVRSARAPAAGAPGAMAELARRRSARESGAARLHPHTGALRVLDAPNVSVAPGAAADLLDAVRAIGGRLGLDEEDLASLAAVRDYTSTSTGLRHVTFEQSFDGLPVFGGVITLHIDGDGSIVRVTSSAARGANRNRRALVTAAAAAASAAQDVGPNAPSRPAIAPSLEWLAIDGGVRLAWHVALEPVPHSEFYDLLIDAVSGELLLRRNRVLDASGTGRVLQSSATQALDPRLPDPMPIGTGACPPPLNHELRDLTAPFRDPETVLFNTGRLSGNNTHVYRGAPGTEGALGTFNGSRWIFDAPFNSAASAESTLFFTLNFAHDFFYDLGFDEAAGNFQVDNFGRGGTGGDPILGVARAAGRNNATFQPQPEGTSPVISMFLWDGFGCWSQDVDGDSVPDIDGDYDSDIVIHEFHHGVTHRINRQFTGSEAGAIGEGGGDFFAYSLNGDTILADYAYSGGIRGVNAKTYADWACLFVFFCEVHDNGEIWANVLWDLRERFRTDLVRGSEAAAVNEMHQVYIDGLKLGPPAPTMLDQRDAMLLADTIRNPGSPQSENYCRLWESFAGRGMGVNAIDTAGSSNNQVTPSFAVPAGCTAPPSVQLVHINATTSSAQEAGPVNGAFTVTRGDPGDAALVVNLSVTGTAAAGVDYVAIPLTVTIPADAASAVIPITPIDDATVESNESVVVAVLAGAGYSTTAPSSATVTIVSDDVAPDFTISAFTVPDTAAVGQSIAVNDTTRNQGAGAGGATTTSFYFSANGTLDPGDTFLGSRDVPALAAGATNAAITTLTLPDWSPAGVYYIFAKADAAGAQVESVESNNVRSDTILIGPDLVISSMTAPANGGAGLSIAVVNATKNQGAGASAASTTRFYLSLNAALDGSDPLLGSRAVPALGPGESNSATTSLTIPPGWGTGQHYVIAVADADNVVSETSNTNNTRIVAIRIGPDLTLTGLTVTARAPVGGSISIVDTTSNAGGGSVDASRTAFYMSLNTAYDAADIPLNVYRAIPALAPAAANSGTTVVALPPAVGPGRWYVLGRADDQGQIVETLEVNNVRFALVEVGPDLVVSSSSAATSVTAGSTLTVTDTVWNYGAGAAAPTINRYYLSLNITLDGSDTPLVGERLVPGLAPTTNSAGSATVQIPTGMSGAYYLLIVADGTGVVGEANETNNVRARPLTITP